MCVYVSNGEKVIFILAIFLRIINIVSSKKKEKQTDNCNELPHFPQFFSLLSFVCLLDSDKVVNIFP